MIKIKKIYLVAVILIAVVWGKFQFSTPLRSSVFAVSAKTGDAILLNDREHLEKNFKKETLDNDNWIRINDYSIAVKELVNKKNARELFQLANVSISDLSRCLKKDFCGMERRSDDDSYFDDSKTPGHILLGRSLEIMLYSLKINPELKNDVDWDLIRELTDSANEKIQVLAVMLLKKFNAKENTEKLLKVIDSYKGAAKSLAFIEISSRQTDKEHALLLNSIEKSFAEDDPNTAINVVENLGKLHLTKNELERVSKNLCHYKENEEEEHNWKMIRYLMEKVNIDLDLICY